MMSFRTLDQADVKDKRVLVRVDLNVPIEDGQVADATRIERVAPTISEIAGKGGKVILLSHFGRPKGFDPKEIAKAPDPAAIAQAVGRPVAFADDCIGDAAEAAVDAMKPGEVLCLENTRFHEGEEKQRSGVRDPAGRARRHLRQRRLLGGTPRARIDRGPRAQAAGLCGIAACRRSSMRPDKALESAERPLAAIVGGAKISTKLDLLGNLLAKVDVLIIGGGMANTFLAAQGIPSASRCASTTSPTARDILAKAKAQDREIVLPVDAVVAQKFEAQAPSRVVAVDGVGPDEMILDIGPRSVEHVVLGAGAGEDAGLERAVRRLRDASRSTTARSRSPRPPRS